MKLSFVRRMRRSRGPLPAGWVRCCWFGLSRAVIALVVLGGPELPLPAPTALAQSTAASASTGISGTAACVVPGAGKQSLPGATVDVLSGDELIATTVAAADASFSFPSVPPTTDLFVRYTAQGDNPLTCGVRVRASGNVPPAPACVEANPASPGANRTWEHAHPLRSRDQPVAARRCAQNESRWFKIAVAPGQILTVTLNNAASTERLAVFKDLAQIAADTQAAPSGAINATLSKLDGLPYEGNPYEGNPYEGNPYEGNPYEGNPYEGNPYEGNPYEGNPTGTTLDDPSVTPGAADPAVYTTAQIQGLWAVSEQGQVQALVGDDCGATKSNGNGARGCDYYARVYSPQGLFDPGRDLTISATVDNAADSGCPTTLHKTSADLARGAQPPTPRTLIVTNTSRLKDAAGNPLSAQEQRSLMAALTDLANSAPAAPGRVLDLATDRGMAANYAQWDQNPLCAPAANIVAEAIHDVVQHFRSSQPSTLAFVTIAGSHLVIPFHLTLDPIDQLQERTYNPPVRDGTESRATFQSSPTGFVMSDDYYINFTGTHRNMNGSETAFAGVHNGNQVIALPDDGLAVGRLVESSDSITSQINVFLKNNGVMRPRAALTVGYGQVAPLASDEAAVLTNQGGVTDVDTLIDSDIDDALSPVETDEDPQDVDWTAPQLDARLHDATRDGVKKANYGIIALNAHTNAHSLVASDFNTHPSVLRALDDVGSFTRDNRFENVLVTSDGCHFGYNLPDSDHLPDAPANQFADFADQFASRGAAVLGSTGYDYSDADRIGYGDLLIDSVLQDFATTQGPVSIGQALTRAKRNYWSRGVPMLGADVKVNEELTFYGPPMWSVDLPGRGSPPAPARLQPALPPPDNNGLASADVAPGFQLTEVTVPPDGITSNSEQGLFEADGAVQQLPNRPTLPLKAFDVTPSNPANGAARGVALLSATYQDLNKLPDGQNFVPRPSILVTEFPGFPAVQATNGFFPNRWWGLNNLISQITTTSSPSLTRQTFFFTPFQWQSDDGVQGIARVYHLGSSPPPSFRLYYSNPSANAPGLALAGPPVIANVRPGCHLPRGVAAQPANCPDSLAHLDVTIDDDQLNPTQDVLLTFTGAPGTSFFGSWSTCSMFPNHAAAAGASPVCSAAAITARRAGSAVITDFTADVDSRGNPSDLLFMVQAVAANGLVSTLTNNGHFFAVPRQPATLAAPGQPTSLTLQAPPTATYDQKQLFAVSATLTNTQTNAPVPNQRVRFRFGAQEQAALTNGSGVASASFTPLELPCGVGPLGSSQAGRRCDVAPTGSTAVDQPAYSVVAIFDGTTDLSPGPNLLPAESQLDQVSVKKQATRLTFGSSPFLVTLTDADNRPMREQPIYFRVTSTNGRATELISSLTNTQGQAELNNLGKLPPGSYALTASYGQLLDTPSHVTVLSDFRYLPSSISSPLTINKKPPDCRLTRVGNNASGQSFIEITTTDASGSGLASISAVTLQNADLPTPVFTNGTTSPVVMTATKQDQSQLARVELNVLDVAGNLTDCDPFLVEVGSEPGVRRVETIHHVARGESTVTVTNLTPGLSTLRILVNGRSFELNDLIDGETRNVDVSSAMRKNDNNTITLIAQGKAHGAAVVMISDSAPADSTPELPVHRAPPRPGAPVPGDD